MNAPAPVARFNSDAAWGDALRAAELIAAEPARFGGAVVKAAAGPVRDAWLAHLRRHLGAARPWQRLPTLNAAAALHASTDLAATLQAGRRVMQPGLLARSRGGLLLLPMAERLDRTDAAQLAAALDADPASPGLLALDEGDEYEPLAAVLAERLAFRIDLRAIPWRAASDTAHRSARPPPDGPAGALPENAADSTSDNASDSVTNALTCSATYVAVDTAAMQALCATALALGVDSMRAPQMALRVACACAARDGRTALDADDLRWAAAQVLAPRARQLPPAPDSPTDDASEPSPDDAPEAAGSEPDSDLADDPASDPPTGADSSTDNSTDTSTDLDPAPGETPGSEPPARDTPRTPPRPAADRALDDAVLEAATASMPAGLLQRLLADAAGGRSARRSAGAGRWQKHSRHGRPAGVRRARSAGDRPLNLIETLRAAVPWQVLRRNAGSAQGGGTDGVSARVGSAPGGTVPLGDGPVGRRPDGSLRLLVRADDFRITRYRERRQTTTIFVVDASGSSALHRLAEAKGAIELLLADCYVRRDRVAVLGFRRRSAELLLPPTRSLTRAKRCLAALPGGGGTPLASALDATAALAETVQRHGDTALVVLLTDGRANIARDGSPGRERAQTDALASARRLQALQLDVLLLDTAPQPQAQARALGAALGAHYLPLPQADARSVSAAVRNAQPPPGRRR